MQRCSLASSWGVEGCTAQAEVPGLTACTFVTPNPGVPAHTGRVHTNICKGVPGASCPFKHHGILQSIFAAQKPFPSVGL